MKRGAISASVGIVFLFLLNARADTPPVVRSTAYNGAYSNIVHYAPQPWMNTNTVLMTIEAWIFCHDLVGLQALVARHYSTNIFFGLNTNRLRFYRSGGTFVDSDGTVPQGRWTHVAVTYDGATARFYINGVNAGTKSLSSAGNNSIRGLSLGGQYHVLNFVDALADGYPFNGYLDEVRIWSVVRSASAIASGMTNEIRSGTGLLATFGSGGNRNDIRLSEVGATTGIPVIERVSGFGMLPSQLCIPWTRALLRVDGAIDMFSEYRGAETIVLRSRNGTHRDKPAYLMVSTNSTNFHLFVGIPDMDQASPEVPIAQVQCDLNPFNGTNVAIGDWECRFDQESFQGGRIFGTNSPPFTNPQWLPWGQSVSNWQGATVSEIEFHQSYEFRIHGEHLNYFTNPIGLLVRYYEFDSAGDQLVAPRGGVTNLPATYARANWCEEAVTGLRSVTFSGAVSNVTLGTNQSGWTVTLISGYSEPGGEIVASVPVNANGTFTISGNVAQERPFHLRLEDRTDYSYLPPEFFGSGSKMPFSTTANRVLSYSACFNASCAPANVRFRVQSPPGPLRLDSMSPTSAMRTVTVRTTPARVHAGDVVKLFGSNIHDRVNVYFHDCPANPPEFCDEGTQIWTAEILSNDVTRAWIAVRVPELPLHRSYRILVEDNWLRSGRVELNFAPGLFRPIDPPYPLLWGFEWFNDGEGPGYEDFESAYGQNIFTYIPFPPFKVRDPYYFTFWYPLYLAMGEASRDGNCHGIAAVSRMFQNGTLRVSDYETAASGGPAGVRFPNGFRGQIVRTDDGEFLGPWRPARWTGFDLFEPFRPQNLWAVIRQNMMAQFSEEGIQNILNQTTFDRGFPVAVLNRVRSNPAGYVLCFQPGGAIKGHCVTPFAVEDNVRLDTNDLLRTTTADAANFSIIRLYDNNWPNRERHMEINRSANTYRYLLGFNDGGSNVWSGSSLYTVPMSFFTSGRHAPGPWNLAMPDRLMRLIFSAGADAQHTNNAGDVWGWDASGNFTNTYRAAKSFFPFALGNYSNRFINTGYAFLPATNPPTGTRINVRGSNFIFQAAMDFTAVQFIADQATAGTGFMRPLMSNSTLSGFNLASANVKPVGSAMIAQPNPGGGSTVYILIGLNLPTAGNIDVRATEMIDPNGVRSGKKGVLFVNRGSTPLTYSFKVESVDGASGQIISHVYGPFQTVPNAGHRLTFPDWPSARQVFSETDFGADGSYEQSAFVAAAQLLFVTRQGSDVRLRWRSSSPNEVVESTDSLIPPIKWDEVKQTPEQDGEWRTLIVPASGAARFFRVR